MLVVSPKQNEQSSEQIFSGMISWDTKPQTNQTADSLDWGAPSIDLTTRTDDLELKWSDEEKDSDSEGSDGGIKINIGGKKEEKEEHEDSDNEDDEPKQQIDIMAQQLKFVACLKILMEELSTLATGFEVDGELLL